MNVTSPNNSSPKNESRIAGYLDTLLIDHFAWDEKLAQATNPPIRPQDAVASGYHLLTTEDFGCGNRTTKHIHLLNCLNILSKLPTSRLKTNIVHSCLPLAAEAMLRG